MRLRDWVITIDIIRIYLTILRLHIIIYSWYHQASTCFWVKIEKVEYQNLLLVYNDPCLIIANNLSLKSNSCCWKMTGSPGQTRPLMWINMSSSWEKICKLIFFQIPVGIWWHWVSRGHYLLVLGGTGSVLGGTDWYLIVLGRKRAALVVTWWLG